VQLVPWLLGAALIAYHVAETRRDASTAVLEARARRMRARLVRIIATAKRFRGERDAARAKVVEQADFVREIDKHGLTILRVEDHRHLRAECDRAAVVGAEARHLRGALERIAGGCEAPQRLAVQALESAVEDVCAS
jgi:hypothetical protein